MTTFVGQTFTLSSSLQGRATVEMNITLKETRQDGVSGGLLKIVADGYNAPVTAGNFIDLVQRGFYNNMEIQRSDGFVVQTGDPGPEQVSNVLIVVQLPPYQAVAGFVTQSSNSPETATIEGSLRCSYCDCQFWYLCQFVPLSCCQYASTIPYLFSLLCTPLACLSSRTHHSACSTGRQPCDICIPFQDNGFKEGDTVRRIPFEVMVKGDKVPFYEETLEDAGRFTDQPVLPFNAYGTMALARGEFEANSGSSQVFWLLKARGSMRPKVLLDNHLLHSLRSAQMLAGL